MKKTIALLMMLLVIPMAFAGSIENLDYKDRVWFWDTNRQVDDYNVIIDSDTLEGADRNYFENRDEQVAMFSMFLHWMQKNYIDTQDANLQGMMSAADATLSGRIDDVGGGMSMSTLYYLTTGDSEYDYNFGSKFIMDMYDERYCSQDQYEAVQDRMDMLEAMIHLGPGLDYWDYAYTAGMIKAQRTGVRSLHVDGHICTATDCVKITPIEQEEAGEPTHFPTFAELHGLTPASEPVGGWAFP